jgi:(E)-4-hydroxy-3-methylbut-2-enyl-diphosphate synthase
MKKRRNSKVIHVGKVAIGGDNPIVVQSMTKTDTRDVKSTIAQIKELEEYGCEIIRVAVPDMEAARALASIKKGISIPLIADIHFDYRLALAALDNGVDGLRLNPGNINDIKKISVIVQKAKEREVPIRIGVNAGSLPKEEKPGRSVPQRMVDAALGHIRLLENLDFDLIKVSLKAFDVPATVEAYQKIVKKIPYPLHIGITESGTSRQGMIRSAAGIGILLWQGIGDTVRVSLTAQPKEEVYAAYEILKSIGLRQHGPKLVSCPTCGRTEVNIVEIADKIEESLRRIDKPVTVAVMGCAVNGPGEAKEADIGIAGGKGKFIVFKRGKKLRTVLEKDVVDELMREIEGL